MQCMFTKGLASTRWSQIPLWSFPDTWGPLAAPPLFAAMCCLSCQVSLWSACASLCKAALHLIRDRGNEFLETDSLTHCIAMFALPTAPLNFSFKAYNNCSIRRCWVQESQQKQWLRCNAFFFHSSLLFIHSFILCRFCFTAFIIHLLNYGWYTDVCYSRARIQSYYGISVKCAGLKQHHVFL